MVGQQQQQRRRRWWWWWWWWHAFHSSGKGGPLFYGANGKLPGVLTTSPPPQAHHHKPTQHTTHMELGFSGRQMAHATYVPLALLFVLIAGNAYAAGPCTCPHGPFSCCGLIIIIIIIIILLFYYYYIHFVGLGTDTRVRYVHLAMTGSPTEMNVGWYTQGDLSPPPPSSSSFVCLSFMT